MSRAVLAAGMALVLTGSVPLPRTSHVHKLVIAGYSSGQLMRRANYVDGRLDGVTRGWYPSGALQYEYFFRQGTSEGVQRQWYPSGQLYTLFNYRDGHEAGQQRMWNADGSIRSNYVIRDDKRYGLLGAMGCTGKAKP